MLNQNCIVRWFITGKLGTDNDSMLDWVKSLAAILNDELVWLTNTFGE